MVSLLKISVLVFYSAVVIDFFVPLLGGFSSITQIIAVFFVVAHCLEAAVFFKHVRKYPGSILMSVFLTLLFGFLHWIPLSKQEKESF